MSTPTRPCAVANGGIASRLQSARLLAVVAELVRPLHAHARHQLTSAQFCGTRLLHFHVGVGGMGFHDARRLLCERERVSFTITRCCRASRIDCRLSDFGAVTYRAACRSTAELMFLDFYFQRLVGHTTAEVTWPNRCSQRRMALSVPHSRAASLVRRGCVARCGVSGHPRVTASSFRDFLTTNLR